MSRGGPSDLKRWVTNHGPGMPYDIDDAGLRAMREVLGAGCPRLTPSDLDEAIAIGLGFAGHEALCDAMGPSARSGYAPSKVSTYLEARGVDDGKALFDAAYMRLVPRPDAPVRVPRLALVLMDEGYIVPSVVFPDRGVASLAFGGPAIPLTTDEAFEQVQLDTLARQSEHRLTAACGADAPWHERYWRGLRDIGIRSVLPDGTAAEHVYIGMGHWMVDLGPYRGLHPWPEGLQDRV